VRKHINLKARQGSGFERRVCPAHRSEPGADSGVSQGQGRDRAGRSPLCLSERPKRGQAIDDQDLEASHKRRFQVDRGRKEKTLRSFAQAFLRNAESEGRSSASAGEGGDEARVD